MQNLIATLVLLVLTLIIPTRPEPGPPKKGEPPRPIPCLQGKWEGHSSGGFRYHVIIEKVDMPATVIYVATWMEDDATYYVGDVTRLPGGGWHEEYRSGGPLLSCEPWQWQWDADADMWKDCGQGWTLRRPK